MRDEARKFVEYEWRAYSREWEINSKHFEAAGYYKWMADKLELKSGSVLEIGCGNGTSTFELSKRGFQIISLDENPTCLKKAHQRLLECGISAKLHLRGAIHGSEERDHRITYSPLKRVSGVQVVLIEGSVTNSGSVAGLAAAYGKFDAVICWLMGTHSAMQFNKDVTTAGVFSAAAYRMFAQSSTYRLANTLLKPGGTLHIVDRGFAPNVDVMADDYINGQNQIPGFSSLSLCSFDHVAYQEPTAEGATKMISRLPAPVDGTAGASCLLSIRLMKPAGT